MSVNNLDFEQAATVLTAIHNQTTGQNAIAPTNLADFISMAQTTLRTGYDPIMNAVSQVIGETIISVRPYNAKFRGLEMDGSRWGGIIRKIQFIEEDPEDAKFMQLADGATIDPWKVDKFKPLETHFYGRDVYSKTKTIFTKQLDSAFEGPAQLGSFITGALTHFSNLRENWLEDLKRAIVANFIAAKYTAGSNMVLHALTEYNNETGLSLTATTVYQPDNFKPFIEWLYARLNTLARKFAVRSEAYQQKITGKPILRHTPADALRLYMLGEFIDKINAMGLANVYNDNYISRAEVTEGIDFWQSFNSPAAVQITPAYIDSAGEIAQAQAVSIDNVIGVMFDRDAMGYTITHDVLGTSPYNQVGEYYNLTANMEIKLMNDITEKGVVIMLD